MAMGIRGFAAIIVVAALMAIGVACGNGAERTSLNEEAPPTAAGKTPTAPIVSHGGAVKDYVSLVDNLRAAGAAVDPAGTGYADYFAPKGQYLTVNREDIQAFEFGSADEADAAAEGVSASGDFTSRFDSETGMGILSSIEWALPLHFYKAGKLIVLYVGCDSDVIEALRETMGSQFAGGAGVSQCPDQVPPAPGVQPVPASMGMPAAIMSGPPLRLTFDGVEYAAVEWLSAASPNGPIRCCGTPINMDDMEVVGTGTRNNPDGDTSVEVYRPKAGATTDVYIFHPAIPLKDREPGGLPPNPAQPAQWVRWTDDIAPPAPAAEPVLDAPDPRLTFEGVEYTGVDVFGALSPTGVCVDMTLLPPAVSYETRITPCLTPINMDDMEVVGTGTRNTDGDASVEVYRPKAGATTDVYTFQPAPQWPNWTRWTAKIS